MAAGLFADAKLIRYVADPDGSTDATILTGGERVDVDAALAGRLFGRG